MTLQYGLCGAESKTFLAFRELEQKLESDSQIGDPWCHTTKEPGCKVQAKKLQCLNKRLSIDVEKT